MDREIELKIVNAFIVKRKRERAVFELIHEDKRDDFLWRLPDYIDHSYIKKIDRSVKSHLDILDVLKAYTTGDECYLLKKYDPADGMIMSLEEGLQKAVFLGPALVSCDHGKVAYLEGEFSWPTQRCLLIR